MQDNTAHMVEQAYLALSRAYVPYSGFRVGACILTTDGHFFTGCNIENASYPLGICAEATAIGNMINSAASKIAEIVIVSKTQDICPPCGGCRQRLAEFSTPETKIHLCQGQEIKTTLSMAELLPLAFTLPT